jgi:hypothetical protein
MQSQFIRHERGQTIAVMAIALVGLLAMAALAIDVAALYVAHSEAQRAANAVVLAGAKGFVTSGFTSGFLGNPSGGTAQDLACSGGVSGTAIVNTLARAAATQNLVVGQAATLQSITCTFPGIGKNPQVTVVVQRTGLPTFFARIWGGTANRVSATASAEAYNPSGLTTPIQTANVKPWLVPNCDPNNGINPSPNCGAGTHSYFVNPTDGTLANNGSFVGRTVTMVKTPIAGPPVVSVGGSSYFALNIPIASATPTCPSCEPGTANDYLYNIACSSQVQLSCGQRIGPAEVLTVNTNAGLRGPTTVRTQCLIHATGNGLSEGQDVITTPNGPGTPPIVITGGDHNPNLSLQGITNISRSDSVVTVPLYDGSDGGFNLCPGGVCNSTKIVGFLQLAIRQTEPIPTPGSFDAVILNASGCNPSATGTPISGGGVSPVPVRLIGQ